MTFGGWEQASSVVTSQVARAMCEKFVNFGDSGGHLHVDTARIYTSGKCEEAVEEAIKGLHVLVRTKAHPSQTRGLSREGLKGQWDVSSSLLTSAVPMHEYYLHQPDPDCDLLESLKFVDGLIKEGKVQKLGLSNYAALEVRRCFELCEAHGLTPPSVYQGLYNPLNRMVEEELLPILREKSCDFIAYNPLAAGLLSGKHTQGGEVKNGRFKNNPNYLPRFYTDGNFLALERIRAACEGAGMTMVEATYIWLLRHSALRPNDGLLLGASSLDQLEANLVACEKAKETPLPDDVREAFDSAWGVTKNEKPFKYWRNYSKDMPGREGLDQGEGYVVKKS